MSEGRSSGRESGEADYPLNRELQGAHVGLDPRILGS